MKYYAIIVGGGSGTRMQQAVAKQFLLLNDKPVLMHTILAFFSVHPKPEIIVVLPKGFHDYWKELCVNYNFDIPQVVVEGGEQRFHSVRNGLMAINGQGVVAIHDAVRPLVSPKLIKTCYEVAEANGNAIPCIRPIDSVRKLNSTTQSEVVDRELLMLIQTPQTFIIEQLRIGYQEPYSLNFTDDSSVVEAAGFGINLIPGERNNFKITYPEDLAIANYLIKEKP